MSRPWLLILFTILSFSCQKIIEKDRPYQVYPQDKEYFSKVIVDSTESPTAIKLVNNEYPIEVELFKDGTFRYVLKKLGDGQGTWTHKDGFIELYAERDLFVMQMEIRSLDPSDQNALALEFSDRWGPQYLKLDSITE